MRRDGQEQKLRLDPKRWEGVLADIAASGCTVTYVEKGGGLGPWRDLEGRKRRANAFGAVVVDSMVRRVRQARAWMAEITIQPVPADTTAAAVLGDRHELVLDLSRVNLYLSWDREGNRVGRFGSHRRWYIEVPWEVLRDSQHLFGSGEG